MRVANQQKPTLLLALLGSVYLIVGTSLVRCQSNSFGSYLARKENLSVSKRRQDSATTAVLTHWSVLVIIRPRPAGNGNATIKLIDGGGTTITTFAGIVLPYSGLAIGVKGPRRDIHNGDTPFGVYKFVQTAGGTPTDQLDPGYGTGKVYLNDDDLFGEVADAHRSLIRLHGGGSALAAPYALNQPLLPTKGCVRMKNRDVNDLIQRLNQLSALNSVQFIFMGDEAYLNTLATNTALTDRPWWTVLRTALHVPVGPDLPLNPSTIAVTSSMSASIAPPPPLAITTGENAAPQSSEPLIEMINVFAEDVGPKGQEALNGLRSRVSELVSLQNSLPTDDALRPKIAFVLCNLDHDCDANMRIVQAALASPSQYKGFFADQAQEMISRLIDREDSRGNDEASTSLTRSLIAIAPQADGALSDGVGRTLSKQLRSRAGIFMSAWGQHFATMSPEEAPSSKAKAFALMRASHQLTVGEIKKIRNYLYSVHDYSEDFGQAVRDFSQIYFHPQRQRQ